MKDQHQIFFNVEVAGSHVLPHGKDLVIFVQFWTMQKKNRVVFWLAWLKAVVAVIKLCNFVVVLWFTNTYA